MYEGMNREWHDGEWWHEAKVGRWMADMPVQWVGPLPRSWGRNRKWNSTCER
jgi:hypothetical protein